MEVISVVRSGVANPRWIARPLSISSEVTTTSTSPGVGKMLMIGSLRTRPLAGAPLVAGAGGNIST